MPLACKKIGDKWRLVEPDGSLHNKAEFDDQGACNRTAFMINARRGDRVYEGQKDLQAAVALSDDEEGLTFEKEVIYEGTFHTGDDEFSVDKRTFDHWESLHKERLTLGVKTPLPAMHTDDVEANRGDVLELISKKNAKGKDALFAKVKFRDAEAAKLAKSADVSLYSPVEQFAAGKTWTRPIAHVALTNYPVIPDLGDFSIVASFVPRKTEGGSKMNPLRDLAGDLSLEVASDADEKTVRDLICSTFQALDKKIKTLESQAKKDDPVKVSKGQLALARENREMKISKLLDEGKVSPHVAKKLIEKFTDDGELRLSFGDNDRDVNLFNEVLEMFAENDPVDFEGKTGPQLLELSHSDVMNDKKNPLLADAKARAEAANN